MLRKIRKLTIDPELLKRDERALESSYCFIANGEGLESLLKEQFGRNGLCLKVFKREIGQRPTHFIWGKTPLIEATRIQNLFALHVLAPRVYSLVILQDKYIAQVTDYVSGQGGSKVGELKNLSAHYGLGTKKWSDFGPNNWVGGKFVDFGEFYFTSSDDYKRSLIEQAHTRRGEMIGTAYQAVPEIGIRGTRDLEHRAGVLRLKEIDFRGKTVLDLGCNLGAFSRLACDLGAKRVVGVDRIAKLAYQVSNWLGYWEIDFLDLCLPGDRAQIYKRTGLKRFDIVFGMAVYNHIGGLSHWIADLCQETFILEGHGSIPADPYREYLMAEFGNAEYLGETSDNYSRQAFRAVRTEIDS